MSSICSGLLQLSNQRRRQSPPDGAHSYSEFDSSISFSPGCLFHRLQHLGRAGVTLLCTGFRSASQGRQHQSCHPTCHGRPCLNPCHNCETRRSVQNCAKLFSSVFVSLGSADLNWIPLFTN